MENITLYDLLTNFDDVIKFNMLKKVKIYSIPSTSNELDKLTADVKEYFLSDVPLYLLLKKVVKVYHNENAIIVYK